MKAKKGLSMVLVLAHVSASILGACAYDAHRDCVETLTCRLDGGIPSEDRVDECTKASEDLYEHTLARDSIDQAYNDCKELHGCSYVHCVDAGPTPPRGTLGASP